MSARDNGGPAFPSHGSMGEVAQEGMTLRDYFAAKFMQGTVANAESFASLLNAAENAEVGPTALLAMEAYAAADAMIAERAA